MEFIGYGLMFIGLVWVMLRIASEASMRGEFRPKEKVYRVKI